MNAPTWLRAALAHASIGVSGCRGGAPPPADVAIRGVTVLSSADGSRAEDRTVLEAVVMRGEVLERTELDGILEVLAGR